MNILEPVKIEYTLETTLTALNLANWMGGLKDLKTKFRHIMSNAYEIDLLYVAIDLKKPTKGEKTPVEVMLFLTEKDKERVKSIMMDRNHISIINQAISKLMLDIQYGFEVSGATAPIEGKIPGKVGYFLFSLKMIRGLSRKGATGASATAKNMQQLCYLRTPELHLLVFEAKDLGNITF